MTGTETITEDICIPEPTYIQVYNISNELKAIYICSKSTVLASNKDR